MEFKDFDAFCKKAGIEVVHSELYAIGDKDGFCFYKDASMKKGQCEVYDSPSLCAIDINNPTDDALNKARLAALAAAQVYRDLLMERSKS